jgi:hypothetical protein
MAEFSTLEIRGVLKDQNGLDSAVSVSFLRGEDGLFLRGWRPAIAQYKGGGTWRSSPFTDGRRIVQRQYDNAIETFDLVVSDADGSDQDDIAQALQDLHRLLEAATNYWLSNWKANPVYLVAQASCETNPRYATIKSWSSPDIDNPYAQPFLSSGGSAMDNIILNIERGHWQSTVPETGDCVYESGFSYDGIVVPGVGPYSPSSSYMDIYYSNPPAKIYFVGTNQLYLGKGVATLSYGTVIQFPGVIAPKDTRVKIGRVNFRAQANAANVTCNVRIRGEYIGNSVVLAGIPTFDQVANRTKTERFVDWNNIGAWVLGTQYDSPDISYILEEIFSHPDWESGNTLAIYFDDNASSVNARRDISSWDEGTVAPRLYLNLGEMRGQEEACPEDQTTGRIYAVNKRNVAQLDEIMRWDNAGGAGPNLLTTANPPYDLFDNAVQVGDMIYFGVFSTYWGDKGPFNNLVFDLTGTLMNGAYTIVWEYWNGAWVALNVQDNTDNAGAMNECPFSTSGINSVHWDAPADWATTTPSADTGWYVRARVTGTESRRIHNAMAVCRNRANARTWRHSGCLAD